jgi:IS5 family transposase
MTDVSADTGSRRQHQNRLAKRRARARRRLRVVTRRIELQPEWLDALETRGYLNPFDRTIAKAEVEAVRKFLAANLGGKHDFAPARRD